MAHAKLYVKFPWWSQAYLSALVVAAHMGFRFDAEKAANVVIDRMKAGVK